MHKRDKSNEFKIEKNDISAFTRISFHLLFFQHNVWMEGKSVKTNENSFESFYEKFSLTIWFVEENGKLIKKIVTFTLDLKSYFY